MSFNFESNPKRDSAWSSSLVTAFTQQTTAMTPEVGTWDTTWVSRWALDDVPGYTIHLALYKNRKFLTFPKMNLEDISSCLMLEYVRGHNLARNDAVWGTQSKAYNYTKYTGDKTVQASQSWPTIDLHNISWAFWALLDLCIHLSV